MKKAFYFIMIISCMLYFVTSVIFIIDNPNRYSPFLFHEKTIDPQSIEPNADLQCAIWQPPDWQLINYNNHPIIVLLQHVINVIIFFLPLGLCIYFVYKRVEE